MGVYSQVANVGFLEAEAALLSFLLLLLYKSESFEKLVSSRLRGHLSLAYMTFGLPLILLADENPRISQNIQVPNLGRLVDLRAASGYRSPRPHSLPHLQVLEETAIAQP